MDTTTNHPAPVKADRTAERRAESRDLVALLQRLGDGEHDDDDLSVAHDAIAEIINLRLQRAALLDRAEALRAAIERIVEIADRDPFQTVGFIVEHVVDLRAVLAEATQGGLRK